MNDEMVKQQLYNLNDRLGSLIRLSMVLQAQIQSLVMMMSEEQQEKWLNIHLGLCSECGMHPLTGALTPKQEEGCDVTTD